MTFFRSKEIPRRECMTTPLIDSRDLRESDLYRQVKAFYEERTAEGRDEITDAADVTLSPDGKFAALTGTVHRDVLAPPITRACLVRIESGEVTRIASGSGNDRSPLWSPDGRWLSFISDRAEAGNFQLYLCDSQGKGMVRAAPSVEGIVEQTQWSPDGQRILLVVAGFGADLAGCQGGATTFDNRHELPGWMPMIETADATNRWRRIYVFDIASFTTTSVATPGFNCWEVAWLGNDRFIAVTSKSHAEGTWYRAELTCFDLESGTARSLYTPADQIGIPAASPDGRTIALIEARCSDRMIVAGTLVLIDAATGAVQHVSTRSVDVTHVAWRDERHLVFIGLRSLETVVGEIDIESGTLVEHWASTQRTCGNWYPSMWPAHDGGCLAICEAYDVAPELARIRQGRYEVVVSFDGRSPSVLAASSSSAAIKPVSWRARDGLELQGWLLQPAGTGPFPLVMDIHGGPIWACRNRWQGRLRGAKVLSDHGFAVFYPNPRGSAGRGADFARQVVGDMGGEDTHDYLTGIDALIERGIIDPKRLGVTGSVMAVS
jgi:dipeptidyl aminopeptidase/acylaminoacyl peptidase